MKSHSLRLAGLVAILLAVAALAVGCGGSGGTDTSASSGSSDLTTIEPGVLTIGSDIPYKPFEFGQPPYEGFDVDVANAVAEKLGLTTKFVKTPFDTIFRDVAQGKFDIVVSAATITPERAKQVAFSDPYFAADQALTVSEGSDIQSVDDLKGKTIGAQLGTTGEDYANKSTDAAEVRTYDLVDDALQALAAGQIEAAIIDFPVAADAQDSGEGVLVAQTIPTDEYYGMAFSPDTPELTAAVNKALQEIKDDGTYSDIYNQWFKQDPPDEILKPGGEQNAQK
jgi:ABC-type amino acid transport substrate-binding protein